MLFHQIGIEAIMAGRYGSMGGENHFPGHARHRLIEADAFFLHTLPNRFEDGKSAMAFVQVKDTGRDAERFQCAQSTYSQEQFLVYANPAIAAVETRGHLTVFRSVTFHIRV